MCVVNQHQHLYWEPNKLLIQYVSNIPMSLIFYGSLLYAFVLWVFDVKQDHNHLQFNEKGKTRVLRTDELGYEKRTG